MKLFVIAALIAVSAAGRLEHLEHQQHLRAYLPPSYGSNSAGQRPFGAIAGAYGTDGPGFNARASYPGASNRYLSPNYGSSASSSDGAPEFAGSINGFGPQSAIRAQQYGQQGASSQYGQQNSNFGVQSRFQSQPSVNRQYLAPSSQNYPQQSFDEQTGYHY